MVAYVEKYKLKKKKNFPFECAIFKLYFLYSKMHSTLLLTAYSSLKFYEFPVNWVVICGLSLLVLVLVGWFVFLVGFFFACLYV